jgi:hypothetical protein
MQRLIGISQSDTERMSCFQIMFDSHAKDSGHLDKISQHIFGPFKRMDEPQSYGYPTRLSISI